MRMGATPLGYQRSEQLAWDTEFWGLPMWKTEHPSVIDTWGCENTRGCLWLLIPARDTDDIHRAEKNGARMVDVRVKLDAKIYDDDKPIDPLSSRGTRTFKPEDVDALAAISRTAFRGLTRFYADPMFPDDRCDDLYENWLRQSCDGWAAQVFVVDDKVGPCGFVTVHLDGDVASIGLIAVDERARGNHLGYRLTCAALAWAWFYPQNTTRMTVVTQGCNIPAQRTFQAAGFRTSDVSVWLHRWAEK